ncbi:MAG TPA: MFS transporter [Nitrolancea sp.]|nr:MFS transporter [Nitrolancea sp.]
MSSESVGLGRMTGGIIPLLMSVLAYRRLWYAGIGYYNAYWIEIVTTGWVVLVMSGSAFDVGLVGFCRTLPMLVLGVTLGAVSDRIRRTTLLLAVQAGGMVISALLALLFIFDRANLMTLCVSSALLGSGWAADYSTRRALISEMQTTERTGNAMSLEAMSQQGSKIGATIVAGALLAAGGATLSYAVLTAIYAYGVVAVLRLRRVFDDREKRHRGSISLIRLIGEGFSTSVRAPLIRAVLLVTVVMNLLVFPYQQIIPVIARQVLDIGPQRMGVLAGADGIGAIAVAGVLVFRARSALAGRVFLGGALSATVIVICLGTSRVFPLSFSLQILAGGFSGAFGAMQPVLIINNVAPEMRARALGVLAMAIGCTPIGILLSGTLSSLFGPSVTLAGTGSVAFVLLVLIAVSNRALIRTKLSTK